LTKLLIKIWYNELNIAADIKQIAHNNTSNNLMIRLILQSTRRLSIQI